MARADTDDPTQTTPTGLYNYAVSYRAAADLIAAQGLEAFHPEAPTQFLYFHAIELYLKSFLRRHGFSVQQLFDISHNFGKMRSSAMAHGLVFGEVETEVLDARGPTAKRTTRLALFRGCGIVHPPVRGLRTRASKLERLLELHALF